MDNPDKCVIYLMPANFIRKTPSSKLAVAIFERQVFLVENLRANMLLGIDYMVHKKKWHYAFQGRRVYRQLRHDDPPRSMEKNETRTFASFSKECLSFRPGLLWKSHDNWVSN